MRDKVEAGGHNLVYELINETLKGPWLVFLHEGLGCIDKWKEFPEKLSNLVSLPAIVYERYGYGQSDQLTEPRQPNFLHHEAFVVLPEVLEKLKISGEIILVGHSDGGSIALLFASRFPEKVKAMLLEAPHVMLEEMGKKGLQAAIWAFQYGDLRERLYKYHLDNTDTMFRGWANIWSDERTRTWNIESCLPSIRNPVLFIQGEHDVYGTTRQMEAIKTGIKGHFTGEILNDCGHIPHHEHEEKVLDIMAGFIKAYL